ncbi:hypothetical protein D3C77_802430 [compost metagenome]
MAARGDQFQCEAGWGENGVAVAGHANGAGRDRLGGLPGCVSLNMTKPRKYWFFADFGRGFVAGGLPTLNG